MFRFLPARRLLLGVLAVCRLGQILGHPPATQAQDEIQSEMKCVLEMHDRFSSLSHSTGQDWRHAVLHMLSSKESHHPDLTSSSSTILKMLDSLGRCSRSKPFICLQDDSIPLPSNDFPRVLIASNMRDNSAKLYHAIQQLLITMVQIPKDKVFVSIYESGSGDTTAEWLLLLDHLLDRMEVPHKIVTGLNGGVKRNSGEERITFLSKIRTLAIQPLQEDAHGSPPEWQADRVLFMNDVYFCAKDILRLLQHRDAALACGMDFNEVPERYPGEILFYDKWVMRDITGGLPSNNFPYVEHPYSLDRMKAGWTFPVSCCWNGMISMDARPFSQGLTFRTYGEHECRECEASNMCSDFYNLGLTDMIVDPGVRVAYDIQTAQQLYTSKVKMKLSNFAAMQSAPAIDMDFAPVAFRRACCNKESEGDMVFFENCTQAYGHAATYRRSGAQEGVDTVSV